MAITVTNAYIETFERTVRQLSQQKQSKLRGAVTEINKQSQTHKWDRLAASVARAKTSARMVSPSGGAGCGAVGPTDVLVCGRSSTLIAAYDPGVRIGG